MKPFRFTTDDLVPFIAVLFASALRHILEWPNRGDVWGVGLYYGGVVAAFMVVWKLGKK